MKKSDVIDLLTAVFAVLSMACIFLSLAFLYTGYAPMLLASSLGTAVIAVLIEPIADLLDDIM